VIDIDKGDPVTHLILFTVKGPGHSRLEGPSWVMVVMKLAAADYKEFLSGRAEARPSGIV